MMRKLLYGQASLDEWARHGADNAAEPWQSFERARLLIHAGETEKAVTIWSEIALAKGSSARQALQALHFIRGAGYPPNPEAGKMVLGAVAELPMHGAHDLLAAYRDGTAHYVNYTGRTAVREDASEPRMHAAVSHWLAVAQTMADSIGPWHEASLPPLPTAHARIAALTTSGPHFGQGPTEALSDNPIASAFLGAATSVMLLVVDT